MMARTGLLPTPIANDAANQTISPSRMGKAKAPGLTAALAKEKPEYETVGPLLNPRFVLEMMGFPPDWCDLTEAQMKQVRQQIRAQGKKSRSIGPEIRSKPLATP